MYSLPENNLSALQDINHKYTCMCNCSVEVSSSNNASDQNSLHHGPLKGSTIDLKEDECNGSKAVPAKRRRVIKPNSKRQYMRYTEETKKQFLQEMLLQEMLLQGMLLKNPYSVASVARKHGVNERTAQQWWQKKRLEEGCSYQPNRGRHLESPSTLVTVDRSPLSDGQIDDVSASDTPIEGSSAGFSVLSNYGTFLDGNLVARAHSEAHSFLNDVDDTFLDSLLRGNNVNECSNISTEEDDAFLSDMSTVNDTDYIGCFLFD